MRAMPAVRLSILLCLVIAQSAIAGDAGRYRGHAQLMPAVDTDQGRFAVRAKLLQHDEPAAGRYQLSARLLTGAQVEAVSAACVDSIFSNSFE
jgi:hypothetical protein